MILIINILWFLKTIDICLDSRHSTYISWYVIQSKNSKFEQIKNQYELVCVLMCYMH